MPFNGAGMFVRVRNWVADATAGIKIRADYHDIEDDNFADGISHCIARDGQSIITANLPLNGKRITALADPTNAQDAATMAYADTKIAKTGDATLTGKLTVTDSITSGSTVTATGHKTRAGLTGAYGTAFFNFNYTATGTKLDAWVDGTNLGTLATQAFANTAAANAAAPKVNRAGDTMTGSLTFPSAFASGNIYYFGSASSYGYIQWSGGGSYYLGGGGYIWHAGNLTPVMAVRLSASNNGNVCTGVGSTVTGGGITAIDSLDYSYIQYLTPAGWYTVGFT